jgi:hypothetical protein
MISQSIRLASRFLEAEVLPHRGGVLIDLNVQNQSMLTETNWAGEIPEYSSYAPDEKTWVERWMGGWQLCAPNAGSGAIDSPCPAFHGAASQDTWWVQGQTSSQVELVWESADQQIEIRRRWQLTEQLGVRVDTALTNRALHPVPVAVAEHLILGSDFLQPLSRGAMGALSYSPSVQIVELDYAGAPLGLVPTDQNSDPRFSQLSAINPATVFALSKPREKAISARVGDWEALIEWGGLEHALIWQEFGFSQEAPWLGQIYALGIEPTNVAHGQGANYQQGPMLEAGETKQWHTQLSFKKATGARNDKTA